MSINATVQAAMSSSDSVPDMYLSVIKHTFSSFGNIFASLGLWVVHGLVLVLCFFGFIFAVFLLFLPIKLIAERIFETASATAPSNERPSAQYQQQDLEANLDASEDVRTATVEQVPDNTTKEQGCLDRKKPSYAKDPAIPFPAPNDSTDEQVHFTNISDPGPSNVGDGERAIHLNDGEIVHMPSDFVDSDGGFDYELGEHDAHDWSGRKRGKPISDW